MLVLLNPHAGGGRALPLWTTVEATLRERHGPFELCILERREELAPAVAEAVRHGERFFVAAGGDGTVQGVAQALLTAPPDAGRARCLGAVGLGSSNDFHKPRRPEQYIGRIPCKLDRRRARRRDVGVLAFGTPAGKQEKRYWLSNCSVGVTAEANAFFNAPDRLLRCLKRWSPPAAILYAALRTLAVYRPRRVRLGPRREESGSVRLTNLAALKNPHCSGTFRYAVPFDPFSGTMHVHLSEGMSTARMLLTLLHLARARSNGLPQTRAWTTDRLCVEADTPLAVEYDGEVVRTRRARFSIRPRALEVCP